MLCVCVLSAIAPATATASPDDLVTAPVVLHPHQIEVSLTAELGLRPRSFAKPLSLAPELEIGVLPRLTLGLIHGNRSVDQIDAGGSFCVRDCDRTYVDGGLDARYQVREGIAPRLRLLMRDVDPFKPAITLGALLRWHRGRFGITGDPYLRIGLANRDLGNRAALFLPVWLAVQPTCRWLIALHTGWNSDLAVVKDGWHAPLAVIITARALPTLDFSIEAGFASLIGPQNQTKQRALLLTAIWRRRLSD